MMEWSSIYNAIYFFPEFRIQLLSLSLDMLVNIPKGLEDKYMSFLYMIQV